MIVIFNPVAGPRRGALLGRVLARLRALGAEVELCPTACAGDATRIAATLAPPADRLVVAAGGDGTLAEVAQGLLRNPAAARLRLGVIPLGTANVLAHEIGLPRRAGAIVRTLLAGRPMPLHVGRIEAENAAPRAFLMMAGAGFDAAVVAAVTPGFKRRCGKGAYLWHALRLAFTGRFAAIELRIDGATHRAAAAVVCNGRSYGGPYRLAPAADLTRPEFEVVLLERAGGLHLFAQALRLAAGVLHRAPGARVLAARQVEILGVGPLQADGDLAAMRPARISATADFLELMTP